MNEDEKTEGKIPPAVHVRWGTRTIAQDTTSEMMEVDMAQRLHGVVADRMAEAHSEFAQKALGLTLGEPPARDHVIEAAGVRVQCSEPPQFTEVTPPAFEVASTTHSNMMALMRNWAREVQSPEPLYLTDEVADLILEQTGRDLHGVQITGVSVGGIDPLATEISDEIMINIDFNHIKNGGSNVLDLNGSGEMDPVS